MSTTSRKKDQDKTLLYRKIYRLRKRLFSPSQIATALEIPLGTVVKVIGQLNNNRIDQKPTKKKVARHEEGFYSIPIDKRQYKVLDIGGYLVIEHLKAFKEDLKVEIESNDSRPLALKMRDVSAVDSSVVGTLTNFSKNMEAKGRRLVILDPSKDIDYLFKQLNVYKIIPVFGTERALEDDLASYIESQAKRRPANF